MPNLCGVSEERGTGDAGYRAGAARLKVNALTWHPSRRTRGASAVRASRSPSATRTMVFIELTTYETRIPSPGGHRDACDPRSACTGRARVPRNVRFLALFRVSGPHVPMPRLIPTARVVLGDASAKRSPHTRSRHC